jgi:transmembrane sensor
VEKENEYMDDLIGKVLSGEASEAEQETVTQWRQQNAANEKYFADLKEIFEKAASGNIHLQFDTDAAWKRVKSEINRKGKSIALARSFVLTPLRVAAALALIVTVSWLIYELTAPAPQTLQVIAEAATVEETLPDGSAAFLNKKSELQFEFNPREKVRKVKLKGEAYFTVKHDERNPFIVETGEVLVRDIGTEFNLKAYEEKDTIEIIVTEGEVRFYTRQNPGVNLKAGERAIYSKRSKQFYKIDKPDTNALAYKTKVFSFNNTDLITVVTLLNEVYNSKIKLAGEHLHHCKLTATYKEDNPETIAEVIAETMELELKHQNGELILSGKGCGE